jgi:hypothetical protein
MKFLPYVTDFMFQSDMAGMEEQHVWESENEEPDITGKPTFRGEEFMALSVAKPYNIWIVR